MVQLIISSLVSICVACTCASVRISGWAGGQIIWVYGLEKQYGVAEKGAWCALSQIHGQREMLDTNNFSLFLSLFSPTEWSPFLQ